MLAIGIDSHKDTLSACLVDPLGTALEYRTIANTPSAAAEETPERAATARRMWPSVIRHVIERLDGRVEADPVNGGRREGGCRYAVLFVQRVQQVERNPLGNMRLATLQLEDAGVVVRHLGPGDAVQVGLSFLPVVRVLHQADVLARGPFIEDERTGANRVLEELFGAHASEVGGHDAGRPHRKIGEERRPWEARGEDDRAVVGSFDRLYGREQESERRLVNGALYREFHIGRRHRLAVGKLDPFPQGNGPRLLYAARIDLLIGVGAVIAPFVTGTLLGAVAGYYGGKVDLAVSSATDMLMAFPYYVLIIALVFSLGPGVPSIFIAMAVVAWVSYARIVRGEVLSARGQEYVLAAKTLGYRDLRIIVRHILPNVVVLKQVSQARV